METDPRNLGRTELDQIQESFRFSRPIGLKTLIDSFQTQRGYPAGHEEFSYYHSLYNAQLVVGQRPHEHDTEYVALIDQRIDGGALFDILRSIAPFTTSDSGSRGNQEATLFDWSKTRAAGYTDKIRFAHETEIIDGLKNPVATAVNRFEPHRMLFYNLGEAYVQAGATVSQLRQLRRGSSERLLNTFLGGYQTYQENRDSGGRRWYKAQFPDAIRRLFIKFAEERYPDISTPSETTVIFDRDLALKQYFALSQTDKEQTAEIFDAFLASLPAEALSHFSLSAAESIMVRGDEMPGVVFNDGRRVVTNLGDNVFNVNVNNYYSLNAEPISRSFPSSYEVQPYSRKPLVTIYPALRWTKDTDSTSRNIILDPFDQSEIPGLVSNLQTFTQEQSSPMNPLHLNPFVAVLALTDLQPYLRSNWPKTMSLPGLPPQQMREAQVVALAAMDHNLRQISRATMLEAVELYSGDI